MTALDTMHEALAGVLDCLTLAQREQAMRPFDDAQRLDWAYYPRLERGLSFADMTHRQRKAVMRLVESGLSDEAFARVCGIIAIEDVLDTIEGRRGTVARDPALYYLSLWRDTTGFFGTVRGWRFQGHHVSINYTFDRRELASPSPLFLGSNPARVSHGGYDLYRPLGDAEDVARELLMALTPDQRAKAVVHPVAPPDIVLANLPLVGDSAAAAALPIARLVGSVAGGKEAAESLRFLPGKPLGLAAAALSAGQRELLARLVALYAGRFPPGVAWKQIDDLDEVHFAWAGGLEPGEGHYYRLHSPFLVVEYDNTQDNANHIHTVCRHPENDFGAKLLGLHYAAAHT